MQIVIETFRASGESSRSAIRARPLPGQGFSTTLRVECSKSMRENHAVGTLFKVWVKLTNRLGGSPFLYSSYRDPYEVVSAEEAEKFISSRTR